MDSESIYLGLDPNSKQSIYFSNKSIYLRFTWASLLKLFSVYYYLSFAHFLRGVGLGGGGRGVKNPFLGQTPKVDAEQHIS